MMHVTRVLITGLLGIWAVEAVVSVDVLSLVLRMGRSDCGPSPETTGDTII
jgi:hypothetical protein